MTTLSITKKVPSAPTNLISQESNAGINLIWEPNVQDELFEVYEIWASNTNDRSTASKIGETTKSDWWHVGPVAGEDWYYWIRSRSSENRYSAWEPSSATNGVYEIVGFVDANDLAPSIEFAVGLSQSTSASTFNNSTYNSYQALASCQFSGPAGYEVNFSGHVYYQWDSVSTASGTQEIKFRMRFVNETTSTTIRTIELTAANFTTTGVEYAQKLLSLVQRENILDDDDYAFYLELQKYRSDGSSTLNVNSSGASVILSASAL